VSDVLFICTANICRSAYAELRSPSIAPQYSYGSAGIQGWNGHKMDSTMAAELKNRGGDPTGFKSRRVQAPMVKDAMLVLTATARHRTAILDDSPAARSKVFSLGQLAQVIETAPEELRGQELIQWVADLRQQSDPRLDVWDPYRKGPEAAVEAADIIDAHLAVILPRL
jgi:protein-tyrosine-phosphatase